MSKTPGCHRREAWGGCRCATPAQVSTCMYRPGKPGEPTPQSRPCPHCDAPPAERHAEFCPEATA